MQKGRLVLPLISLLRENIFKQISIAKKKKLFNFFFIQIDLREECISDQQYYSTVPDISIQLLDFCAATYQRRCENLSAETTKSGK